MLSKHLTFSYKRRGILSGMPKTHKKAEFREAKFFPVNIFRTPDKLFDSVNDADIVL